MDDQNRKLAGLILNCRPDELRGASLRADGSLAVVAPNGMKFIFSPVELENARDSFGLKAESGDSEKDRLLRQAQQSVFRQAQQSVLRQAQQSVLRQAQQTVLRQAQQSVLRQAQQSVLQKRLKRTERSL